MQSTQFTSHQGPPSSIKDDFFTTETYANLATKNHNRSIFHFSQSVTTADLKLLANRSANKCRNAQSVRKERYLEGTKKSGSTYSLSVTYRLAVSPAAAVLNFYFDFFSCHSAAKLLLDSFSGEFITCSPSFAACAACACVQRRRAKFNALYLKISMRLAPCNIWIYLSFWGIFHGM